MTDTLERVKTYKQFIGGEFVDAADGRTAEVINPEQLAYDLDQRNNFELRFADYFYNLLGGCHIDLPGTGWVDGDRVIVQNGLVYLSTPDVVYA